MKDYVNAAGWYFKTLAAQEAGESNVLMALYGNQSKDTEVFTDFLPFFGTDYGLCSLIKPQVSARDQRCFALTLSSLLSFPANPLAQQLLGRLAGPGRQ